ncbi:MAG: 3-isopropylmalate dehydratase small subunit [Elusimicrobiota bacterium]|jgi:3-isopropylmalate/(R)-2-methylmalate dehydratase small subunit|nr:3-isopropylmalate dehydratase small subunit [Elusimicrobiota bacterium]
MSDIILKGQVHKYGSNVNTDEIIAARYLNSSDPAVLAKYCMEDIDKDFVKKVKPGDVIVAESNFGCGSSREHAPIVIKASGISAVIANSFARIFFRNSINIGLPILESPEAVEALQNGDTVEINLSQGKITNITKDEVYTSQPFPEFMQKIVKAGGLMEYIKK